MRNIEIKKTLAILALSLSLAFSSGCTGEKAKSFWNLVEVSGKMEHGLKNYYTPAEKRQQEIDLNRDMKYIHNTGEKYKKD